MERCDKNLTDRLAKLENLSPEELTDKLLELQLEGIFQKVSNDAKKKKKIYDALERVYFGELLKEIKQLTNNNKVRIDNMVETQRDILVEIYLEWKKSIKKGIKYKGGLPILSQALQQKITDLRNNGLELKKQLSPPQKIALQKPSSMSTSDNPKSEYSPPTAGCFSTPWNFFGPLPILRALICQAESDSENTDTQPQHHLIDKHRQRPPAEHSKAEEVSDNELSAEDTNAHDISGGNANFF